MQIIELQCLDYCDEFLGRSMLECKTLYGFEWWNRCVFRAVDQGHKIRSDLNVTARAANDQGFCPLVLCGAPDRHSHSSSTSKTTKPADSCEPIDSTKPTEATQVSAETDRSR